MRNIVDLSSLTDKELAERLTNLKSELFNLRFTHRAGSLENNMALSVCKRNIARVKTIIRQRELGLAVAPVKEDDKKPAKKAVKSEPKAAEVKVEKTETKTAAKKATKTESKVAEKSTKTVSETKTNKKTTKASAKVDAEVKG